MKKPARLLYFLGATLIIVFLAILNALRYSTMEIEMTYAFYSSLVLLVFWITLNLLFRPVSSFNFSRTSLGKTLGVWLISITLGSVINHLLLLKLLENSANHPVYSVINTLFLGFLGAVLLIVWHLTFMFGRFIWSLNQTSALRRTFFSIFYLIVALFLFGGIINLSISLKSQKEIYSINDVPPQTTGIVFGAGVYQNKYPSTVLIDRIHTAASLYSLSKVKNIILSGDGDENNNEVNVMYQVAIKAGIPSSAIVMDKGGYRTIDTCSRAHTVFGVTQAILITQNFHMPRALFLCNHKGIISLGVVADNESYSIIEKVIWYIRGFFATILGWIETIIN
jgi:SanA protein